MPNQFPAGRDPLTEMVAALGRLHFGFGGFCTGTTDERGVCNSCGAQLAVPPPPPTSIQDDLAIFRQEAATIFERELATLRRRHGVRSERTTR